MCTINQDHMMYDSWDIKCKGQSFCHFGPFLPFDLPNNPKNQNFEKIKTRLGILSFILVYHKWSYDLWFLRYRARQTEFFHILDHFLSFYTPSPSPNSPESQSLQKMKKTPRGIIILQKCIINDNHMIYGLWDMKCNRQNFFVILGHFLNFNSPPLTAWKMKISK